MLFGVLGLLGTRMRKIVWIGNCPTARVILEVDVGRLTVANGEFVA